jgi:hypothetical protein
MCQSLFNPSASVAVEMDANNTYTKYFFEKCLKVNLL